MTLNATQFMKAAAVLCASLVCSQATIARDYANWMAELPDNLYVTQVSIPGTHSYRKRHRRNRSQLPMSDGNHTAAA